MKRYYVTYGYGNGFWTDSRNAKRHLRELGGDSVKVYATNGMCVSYAGRNDNGDPVSLNADGCFLDNHELARVLEERR